MVPAKNHRVNLCVERSVYDALSWLARDEGASLSAKARDLLKEALETYEDLALAKIAKERERMPVRSVRLTHNEVWRGRRTKED